MKAITLYQPWASLIALGVKTIETRSWPAPGSLIGERIAIHAGKKVDYEGSTTDQFDVLTPDILRDRHAVAERTEDQRLLDVVFPEDSKHGIHLMPHGAIVATAVLTDCVPIERCSDRTSHVCHVGDTGLLSHRAIGGWHDIDIDTEIDISAQLPYGDFSPGRWAWLLDDIETDIECPPCEGSGIVYENHGQGMVEALGCPDCQATGRTPLPIHATGHQRVWKWSPE